MIDYRGSTERIIEYRDLPLVTISSNISIGWFTSYPNFEVVRSGFELQSSRVIADTLGDYTLFGSYLSFDSTIRPVIGGWGVQGLIMGFARGNANGFSLSNSSTFLSTFESGLSIPLGSPTYEHEIYPTPQ